MPVTSFTHLHFTGACGRALGPLVVDLKNSGHSLSATDEMQYAPMDQFLKDAGLRLTKKFAARNVPKNTSLLIMGAAITPDNVEVQTALKRGIPVCNMAQFIGRHLLSHSKRFVIAGTKGKTTTTAMLAWILEHAGKKPDYLFGGQCLHFPLSVRMQNSPIAILEGDEYPSAKDDRTAKFHYYQPHTLIVTNIHLDHPEIYPTLKHVKAEFRSLSKALPTTGRLILNAQCPNTLELQKITPATVETVGWTPKADHRITHLFLHPHGTRFHFSGHPFSLPQTGRTFALDAALATRAALAAGVSIKKSAAALAKFEGVLGRMQSIIDDDRLTFILDEAYHPFAIAENLQALKTRYPDRRLVVVIQPRNTGGRDGFQERDLPKALTAADRVILLRPWDFFEFPNGPFSNKRLTAAMRQQGIVVSVKPKDIKTIDYLPTRLRRGDVFYCSFPPGCDFIVSPLATLLRDTFLT